MKRLPINWFDQTSGVSTTSGVRRVRKAQPNRISQAQQRTQSHGPEDGSGPTRVEAQLTHRSCSSTGNYEASSRVLIKETRKSASYYLRYQNRTNLRVPLKWSDGRAQWQNPCDTKRLLSLLVILAIYRHRKV